MFAAGTTTREILSVDGIPVPEQIMRRDCVGESLNHLLSRPASRGRVGDIEMKDFATVVGQHQKDVEDTERGGWDRKEIHCHQGLDMVLKEGLPGLD